MTRVIAAIDAGPGTAPVTRAAHALAEILHSMVDAVHVVASPSPDQHLPPGVRTVVGNPVEVLRSITSEPDVAATVVGTRRAPAGRRPLGHVAATLAESSDKPVLVVPPEVRPGATSLRNVLIPVEGVNPPSDAIVSFSALLTAGDRTINHMHVFAGETTPAFWNSWREQDIWAARFARENLRAGETTTLFSGDVCSQILQGVALYGSDLIVLEWGRRFDLGHGHIVSDLLDRADLPILLVLDTGAPDTSTSDHGSEP